MFIELRGVEFVNKGAELMLYAILDSVKKRYPDAKFVMEKREKTPIDKQRELRIYTKFKFRKFNSFISIVGKVTPSFILNAFKFAKMSQVKVVIDGSGFAFGDKWGAEKVGERLSFHIIQWKKEGKKIILLPQAFGPFSTDLIRERMNVIIDYADLIYARDPFSYKYVQEINNEANNINLKPDFTNLVEAKAPEYFDKNIHQVAVIPNFKMLDATSENVANQYINFLVNVISHSKSKGFSPYLLIHEGQRDVDIANQVNELLDKPVPVVKEENPLIVKGYIKYSTAVVSSRFHGLVSALSQGIPCLSTGWSHKYEMLLKDYDYIEGLCNVQDETDTKKKLNEILDPEKNKAIKNKLINKAAIYKNQTKSMWEEVFEVIDQK